MLVEDPDPTNTRPGTWRKFFERCVLMLYVRGRRGLLPALRVCSAPRQRGNSSDRALLESFKPKTGALEHVG